MPAKTITPDKYARDAEAWLQRGILVYQAHLRPSLSFSLRWVPLTFSFLKRIFIFPIHRETSFCNPRTAAMMKTWGSSLKVTECPGVVPHRAASSSKRPI
jgi:hypothetical protein